MRYLVAAALVVGASNLGAQIIRPVLVNRPAAYASASAGWLQQQAICDGASKACWNFGSATQYRGSFEIPTSGSTSIGVSYSTARVPLTWADNPGVTGGCGICDADANVEQLMGLVHMGGGTSFQQVIDLSVGVTQFSGFRTTSGTPLGPGGINRDFSFAIAYGFGFNVTQSLLLSLQQEFGVVVHERAPGTSNNSAQQQILRLGVRYAIGR